MSSFIDHGAAEILDVDSSTMSASSNQNGSISKRFRGQISSIELLDDTSSETSSDALSSNSHSSIPTSPYAPNDTSTSYHEASKSSAPTSLSPTSKWHVDNMLEHQMYMLKTANNGLINIIAEILAAWAILLGCYTASEEVPFGVGFQEDLELEHFRILIDETLTVLDLLRTIKLQYSGILPNGVVSKLFIRSISVRNGDHGIIQSSHRAVSTQRASKRLSGSLYGESDSLQSREKLSAMSMAFELNDGFLVIKVQFNKNVLQEKKVRLIMHQVEHVFKQVSSEENLDKPLAELDLISPADLHEMNAWARVPIPSMDSCVHHLIERQARQQPNAMAVSTWDANLTYAMLDELSNRLAHYLKSLGVGPEVLVPFCFEKSAWAVTAMLGILKAGGACIGLDVKHPMARLEKIVEDSNAKIIVTSKPNSKFLAHLPVTIVSIDEVFLKDLPLLPYSACTSVNSKHPAYVTFTSGTTGQPKGIVIEHSAICVSGRTQKAALRLGPGSRVLQFAAYSFDISNGDVFNTLMNGGCICVPSEDERSNDLVGFINRMGVNWACLTPSVASLLQPSAVPTLETLVLCGEPIRQETVQTWADAVYLIAAYGPAETTILCTSFPGVKPETNSANLGWNMGARTWIVSSLNHNKLCPLGCVGEILIEGPLLARGYLNDSERTAASFINDPLWTRNALQGGPSRRFYKSGDLGFFNTDGTITFMGRKDTQVKVRGNRIELREVEHHLRSVLPATINDVVAEVVPVEKQTVLVAFVCLGDQLDGEVDLERISGPVRQILMSAIRGVEAELAKALPAYMIPSIFLPLKQLPLNQSGKIDRRKLRSLVSKFTSENMTTHGSASNQRKPSNELEKRIQAHWARVLDLDPRTIGADDNFFKLGGDSLSAMKLVAVCRADGIRLSVASVFQASDLSDLAANVVSEHDPEMEIAPFALIDGEDTVNILRDEVLAQCTDINEIDTIEDIYPCTPQQEGLIAMSLKQRGSYVAQDVTELPAETDLSQFRAAWEQTIRACAILRTRIIQSQVAGSVQVVLKSSDPWFEGNVQNASSLDEYLENDRSVYMDLGQPLSRYAIIMNAETGTRHFVWTIHHALYDGWSLPLIKDLVETAYAGRAVQQPTKFNQFVQNVLQLKNEISAEFWRFYFEDAESPSFPYVSPPTYQPHARSILDHNFNISQKAASSYTLPTLIRAAWGLLIGRYVDSSDVSFGATLAGRNAPISDVDTLIGPTIATVPVRIRWTNKSRIDDFLQNVQDQLVAMIPFEHSGLQNIQTVSEEARIACQFQSHLIIQPFPTEKSNGLFSAGKILAGELSDYGSYALIIQCMLTENEIVIRATYDENVVDHSQAQRYVNHFEHLILQLCSAKGSETINDLETISPADEAEIMVWNSSPLKPVDSCFQAIFKAQEQLRPDAVAVCSWDGTMTYRELDQLSTRLAHYLVAVMGVKSGTFVPLCFEKSMWTMVAIMATFKAGAAIVPLDPFHPLSRRHQILSEARAKIILCSSEYSPLFSSVCDQVLVIDGSSLEALPPPTIEDHLLPTTPSTSPLYAIFTSGSTGVPKGVIIEHGAFLSSATAYGEGMFVTSESRVLLYSSYSFDISILEMLTPLIFGGCICVVSDKDRLDDLGAAMSRLEVNWSLLTPTVARTIHPKAVPSLEVLLLGGEALEREDVAQWAPYVKHLINAYGPTESSVVSSAFVDLDLKSNPRNIGRPFNAKYWITAANDHNRLVSIGAVGELLIEGPILARGYLNNVELTEMSFIEHPAWTRDSQTKSIIQSSDRSPVRRRFYKTGDLVHYDVYGNVIYVGRKDNQVKLRGQRIELGEIQYQILRLASEIKSVVVEVINVGHGSSPAMLVAFAYLRDAESNSRDLLAADSPPRTAFLSSINSLESRLLAVLPKYMIPSLFLPLSQLPMTVSHKVDRKQLQALVRNMSNEELTSYKRSVVVNRKPSTPGEEELQRLWATVLKLQTSQISAEDSFFSLGGDSILAIHLVGACRKKGLSLSVPQIFQTPKLADMALLMISADSSKYLGVPPFHLLSGDFDDILAQVATQCSVSNDDIEDIYPCTALQESLVVSSVKNPGTYVARFVFELTADVDLDRFRLAVELVVNATPILRTRIFQGTSSNLLQVVLRSHDINWNTQPDIEAALLQNHRASMTLNEQLAQYDLVKDNYRGKVYFVWKIHHVLYDGWSMASIRKRIAEAYETRSIEPTPEAAFNRFVRHTIEKDKDSANEFWRGYLEDAVRPAFPVVPPGQTIQANQVFHYQLKLANRSCSKIFTLSTIIRAAWALVVQSYSGSSDVVFGATLSGRDTLLEGIERISGPTIATVPIRVILDSNESTVACFLQRIQDQMTDMIPYQHTGVQNIQRISEDAYTASKFQNLLVVQPSEDESEGICSSWSNPIHDVHRFNSYALMVQCSLPEIVSGESTVSVEASYDSRILDVTQMQRIMQQFQHITNSLLASDDLAAVGSIEMISPEDKQEIATWNESQRIQPVEACLHEMFEERVHLAPESTAISSWDGEFTYRELNRLASQLCLLLKSHGVKRGSHVALCFEKSKWMAVASLATLKAGGAIIALDHKHPVNRLEHIISSIKADLLITSRACSGLITTTAKTIAIDSLTIDQTTVTELGIISDSATPNDIAVVVFTSGSTGAPKGYILEHKAICSSATAFGKAMFLNSKSRIFQFGSHAHDAMVLEILVSLMFGACVCIPSEEERLSKTAEVMHRLAVNWTFLTPSVARLINPADVPDLATLVLGGEALSESDIKQWTGHVQHLINGYGPGECSIFSSSNIDLILGADASNIGRTFNAHYWVTIPNDVNRLCPIGGIGELLVEGPILARGYLNQPDLTAAAFIKRPRWAKISNSNTPSKLYRTGDLVRYNSDGSVNYIGRIDNQVKVRGQRTELAEVEHQLRRALPNATGAIVEIVKLEGEKSREAMVAFLCFGGRSDENGDRLAYEQMDPQMSLELASIRERLTGSLPMYMIPSHFIPFQSFPLTRSGKTDRRKLSLLASNLSLEDLNAYASLSTGEKRAPSTPTEILLRVHWAAMLKLDIDRIGTGDNFFKLGGDSITAMHLVATLRKSGHSLLISDLFRTPVLQDMARAVRSTDTTINCDPDPFSLLGDEVTANVTCAEGSSACDASDDAIEDIYPCTPLQEGLMALSIKRPGSYIAQFRMNLPVTGFDVGRFQAAWEHVVERTPILRTRIFASKSSGSMQAVLRDPIEWLLGDDLDLYLEQDRATNMTLGARLARYAIISDSKQQYFIWTLHHALYDAWSIRSILRSVDQTYNGKPMSRIVGFNRYIRHIMEVRHDFGVTSEEFWQSQLAEGSPSEFPALPSTTYQSQPDSVLAEEFSLPSRQQSSCTLSTLIWAAWTLVISRCTGSLDILFGATLSGRYAPIPDIEDVVGPTLNTVPVRHKIELNQTVDEYLENFQTQYTSMIPFETLGLQRIQQLSSNSYAACQFRSMIVIQPQVNESFEGTGNITAIGEEHNFASYPLTMECILMESHLEVSATFDSKVIDRLQMQRIMHQFKHAITQLCNGASQKVGNLEILSPEDIQEIGEWNRRVFQPVDKYLDGVFRESVLFFAEAIAIDAWDGQLTYSELDRLSTSLACCLMELGVAPEVLVPLCFTKSKWVVVAMLAVSKAGGAFVPMDPSQPVTRLNSILTQTQSRTILCSAQYFELLRPLCENTIVVGEELVEQRSSTQVIECDHRSTQDAAYVIFTSGSTGDPKGCVVTHQAYCSSSTAYSKELVDSNTRALQFASYSFDACILEIFTPLAAGGCVCIPSEQSRLNDLSGTISNMTINWAALTPSTARLIDPKDVPTLKTLLIGGEALSKDDIPRWQGHAELFHMYGPTETAVVASRFARITESTHPNNIGRPFISNFWIVDSSNHDILLPVGATGELLVNGPILAREYMHDPEKTSASFIEGPKWLPTDQFPRRVYKTGDLVRYNSDGTMNFVGRKDTQIKLRGLRIQLDEVEYHLQKALPSVERIIAELVHVEGKAMLVAFLSVDNCADSAKNHSLSDEDLFRVDAVAINELASLLSEVEDTLSTAMLTHMMPSAYIPLRRIPTAFSGKTDRTRLRRFVSGISTAELDGYKIQKKEKRVEPSTIMERELQAVWSSILGLRVNKIGARDSFFKLGGDSVMAIRLVGACRARGILLSATDVFQNSKLCDMSLVASNAQDKQSDEVAPFSLIGNSSTAQQIRIHAAAECGVTEEVIEDIYPCTALQEGLMAISIKTPGAYIVRGAIEVPEGVDVNRFKKAWETTVESNPILRTRIIQSPQSDRHTSAGFLQVVTKGCIVWQYGDSLDDFVKRESTTPMTFGGPLARYSFVQDANSGKLHFIWTLHHALYDFWSLSLILRFLNETYQDQKPKNPIGFNTYIKHLVEKSNSQASEDYWRSSLQGAAPSDFPPSPPTSREPQPDSALHHIINISSIQDTSAEFTISTIIRAAWAILVSRYTDSHDVVFGAILSGRTAPVLGIEEISGPTINTVPIRLVIDPRKPVLEYLRQVQDHSTEILPFETLGLQRIQHLNESAHVACQFQNLLIVQPAPADNVNSVCPIRMTATGDLFDNLRTYALAIQCTPVNIHGKQTIQVDAGYDSSTISQKQVQRVLSQFDYLIQQMCQATKSLLVSELDVVSLNDRKELREWTGGPIRSAEKCLDEMFEASVHKNSERSAVNAWDGNFTYDELNEVVNRLAKHLIDVGVGAETKVPLLFQKTRWTVVAMLSVVKAGGAIVPMDPAHPRTRLEFIIEAVDATVVLCSSDQADWLAEVCKKVIVVDASIERLPTPINPVTGRTTLSSALYIIFTSGSTGEPKGCIIEHRAFCSSALFHAKGALFGPSMRILQLASYSFGAAVGEIFSTLLHGGCLCIVPNEARANLPSVVKEMNVNFMFMSPTFARLIPPQAILTVKTLLLGSETMLTSDIEKWSPHVRLVQGYGQTECSTIAACFPDMMPDIHPRNVGYPMAAKCWIVDPSNHNNLAPLGAVGELLIEGPILARGYLNDPEKTAAAFVEPPAWRQHFEADAFQRMYKTGDLARYHDDGTLVFIGRKDTQVKLRGQRVELGEIEYHLRRLLPAAKGLVVELIETPTNEGETRASLVAFVCLGPDFVPNNDLGAKNPAVTEAFLSLLSGLAPQLSEVLPSYMNPSAYLPLEKIPYTTSGKVDRRRLREMGSALSIEQLAFYSLSKISRREPATPMEKRLQKLWATVLNIDIGSISAESNFLQLGGDSINAIKLVSACRAEGMKLSVAEIFKGPALSQMAEVLHISSMAQYSQYVPFSCVENSAKEDLIQELVKRGIVDNEDNVENIMETTYMQSLFVASGLMEHRSKTNYISLQFSASLDAARLEAACRVVVSRHQILRTVFIPHQQQLLQVVLRSFPVDIKHYKCESDIESLASKVNNEDSIESVHFGKSFLRFMLFDGGSHGFRLTLRINHAQFDGMSFPHILDDLAAAYRGTEFSSSAPDFSDFIYHVREVHDTGAVDFYRNLLADSAMTEIANQTKPSYNYPTNEIITRRVSHVQFLEHGITFPAVLKAAWSMSLTEMTGNTDVVFGYLVNGRNLPIAQIDEIVGPCINITPVRIRHQGGTALELLEQVRDQNLEAMPYENYSFEKIVANCTQWPRWTRCSTIVQCQHIAIESGSFAFGDMNCYLTATNPPSDLADVIVDAQPIGPTGSEMSVSVLYNPEKISSSLVERMAERLVTWIAWIANDVNMALPLTSEQKFTAGPMSLKDPNHSLEFSRTISNNSEERIESTVQKVWKKVLGSSSGLSKQPVTAETPFFEIWGSLNGAVHFAECYGAEMGLDIKMEEIIEHPSKRLQNELIRRKWVEQNCGGHVKHDD